MILRLILAAVGCACAMVSSVALVRARPGRRVARSGGGGDFTQPRVVLYYAGIGITLYSGLRMSDHIGPWALLVAVAFFGLFLLPIQIHNYRLRSTAA